MISVKKQGPYEVFSRGVEEPWAIYYNDDPYREVWTWDEVEKILREAPVPSKKRARYFSETREGQAYEKAHGPQVKFDVYGAGRRWLDYAPTLEQAKRQADKYKGVLEIWRSVSGAGAGSVVARRIDGVWRS
jgi:hypothetical protein